VTRDLEYYHDKDMEAEEREEPEDRCDECGAYGAQEVNIDYYLCEDCLRNSE